mgnify:FL=1|tara:strand:- start:10627 stop:11856 length:1230 start_codon:yes stop_codon:yes gene_type:complete
MNCRHCKKELISTFLDLATAPPSNAYLSKDDLEKEESYFPLKVMVCNYCWLVQTLDYTNAEELFSEDYAYFSSTSSSFLAHAKEYSKNIISNLSLDAESFVVEIASNDGYLLKNFVESNIPCLGIEPTDSTADAAEKLGIPVLREFFGKNIAINLSESGKKADLILGNNVYAHVPDINDFTKGLAALLKLEGTITLEFPHLMRLLEFNQFDTVYHEHFSYLSLHAVTSIFDMAGLRIYNVEELSTHGGSIRVFGCHANAEISEDISVKAMLEQEHQFGITNMNIYDAFQNTAEQIKESFIKFLDDAFSSNKVVAGYGAAAKGNTLMNYAAIKDNIISFVCDAAPAKQNKFLPGTHIPILHPDLLISHEVDYIIIFPWNISSEVKQQLREKIKYKAKFVTFVPELIIEDL